MAGTSVPTGTQAEVCLPQHHSVAVTMVTAPISPGWTTYPGALPPLVSLAPHSEIVRWEYQTDSHLTGMHHKENLTQRSDECPINAPIPTNLTETDST